MRILFIITFSLLLTTASYAQEYVTDATMEETLMAKDDQIKVLYFTAPWCGPCKYMAPVIKSISEDKTIDVTIYKMNTDDNITDDILKVNSIPTYFFIKNGRKLGHSSSVMRRNKMVELIEKHDAMEVKGGLLPYRGKPSKYEIVAGAHENLTKKNIEQLWHNPQELNELSWKIYKNLTTQKDLKCALSLVNRSIELEEKGYNLQTKAHVLYKMKDHKESLKTAQKAKKRAARSGTSTTIIEELIKKLEAE
ncbi:thioredoxin domain-containing protein [uncultured Nonlabens sp.]|jgi:thioredoxin-like negative regulator of GroEL|uniref:thioredoxin family protein n=1 Tax=uncultured Nonlabens sp. TaxID=859306 RepID=UPI0030D900F5|tara:strand:- start:39640 stop:40392 length:753 start_codon:yes stop_codon:yes gene_type:complete